MELKKLQKIGSKNAENFKKVATDIIMDELSGVSDETKDVITTFTARDMAIGAAIAKNKFLLAGAAIGSLGAYTAIRINNKMKNRKKKKDEEKT